MSFEALKGLYMKRLKEAKEKGLVDEPIIYLLDAINACPQYFTTSSCAGRIILIKSPFSGRKNEAEILFKSHNFVSPEEVWNQLTLNAQKFKDPIYFQMEPFILHVSAKSVDDARVFAELSQRAGIKHSGILVIRNERAVVEVESTERIEAPVAVDGKIIVQRDYLDCLVREANRKLLLTRLKMHRLYKAIRQELPFNPRNEVSS